MCYPDSSHGVHSRNPHAPAIRTIHQYSHLSASRSLPEIPQQAKACYVANQLASQTLRSSSFVSPGATLYQNWQGGPRTSPFPGSLWRKESRDFRRQSVPIAKRSAVSVIDQKRCGWTGVSWCCALFTPLFWSLAETRRGAVSRASCGLTTSRATTISRGA